MVVLIPLLYHKIGKADVSVVEVGATLTAQRERRDWTNKYIKMQKVHDASTYDTSPVTRRHCQQ
jgi:hypothetical protein